MAMITVLRKPERSSPKKFSRLVYAQERGRGRHMELELFDAILRFGRGKHRPEQADQSVAILFGHRVLRRRYCGDDGAHGGGALGFLGNSRLERVVMTAKLALVGPVDDAGNDPHRPEHGEQGGRRRRHRQRNRDPHPEAEREAHVRLVR
ncbi:hypothetical protein ACVWWO_006505 [Bradyrhizobium sp. F1.13.1]